MDILKIVPASRTMWDTLNSYLQQELQCLEKDHFHYSIVKSEDDFLLLTCKKHPEHLSATEIVDTYRHYFSTAISEYVVEELEQEIVKQMIRHDFAFQGKAQIESIYHYCYLFLFLEEEQNTRDELKVVERKCKVFKKAYEYLEEDREFNVDGFLRFRLKEYKEELAEVIEYAIDEFILDKEYQEFIKLLRYFISKQGSKMPFLHVYHIEGQKFLLFDNQGNMVTDEEVEKHLQKWSNHSVSKEDLIVSTLITINPNRFILHTNEPHITVIQTLKKIFRDQISICDGCKQCQHWKSQQIVDSKT